MTTDKPKPINWNRWLEFGAVVLLAVFAHLGVRVAWPPTAPAEPPPLTVTDVTDRTISLTSPDLQRAGVRSVGVVLPGTAEPPVPEKQTRDQVIAAIGRVRFGDGACTAQAVYPRRADRRWGHRVRRPLRERGRPARGDAAEGRSAVRRRGERHRSRVRRGVAPHRGPARQPAGGAARRRGARTGREGVARRYGWDRPNNVEEGR